MNRDKVRNGMYGLLVGDALGVPYEFTHANDMPLYSEIEMTPPRYFARSHRSAGVGSWSDDGSQALCLLASLTENGKLDIEDFAHKMLMWYEQGYMAVDGKVFDIGIQTANALRAYKNGVPATHSGAYPSGKGNGALMRVLPLALWHSGSDEELVELAHRQCLPTHGAFTNQVCCALYCVIAQKLLSGQMNFKSVLEQSMSDLRKIYKDKAGKANANQEHEYLQELEDIAGGEWIGFGSGYVVDTLKSAFMVLLGAHSYEEAVRKAILLGDDTDTTACVTGGLAGIMFGDIPKRWLDTLREKETVEKLLSLINY